MEVVKSAEKASVSNRIVAAIFSAVVLSGCFHSEKKHSAPVVQKTPTLGCDINTSKDKVEILSKNLQAAPELRVRHTVNLSENLTTIVDCYFANESVGLKSIEASNGLNPRQVLQTGRALDIYITKPGNQSLPKNSASSVLINEGLSLKAAQVLTGVGVPSATNSRELIVPIPQQAKCQDGEAYYIVQPGDVSYGHLASEHISGLLGKPSELWDVNLQVNKNNLHAGEVIISPLPEVTAQATAKLKPDGLVWC